MSRARSSSISVRVETVSQARLHERFVCRSLEPELGRWSVCSWDRKRIILDRSRVPHYCPTAFPWPTAARASRNSLGWTQAGEPGLRRLLGEGAESFSRLMIIGTDRSDPPPSRKLPAPCSQGTRARSWLGSRVCACWQRFDLVQFTLDFLSHVAEEFQCQHVSRERCSRVCGSRCSR
jgi:hypothetical protein